MIREQTRYVAGLYCRLSKDDMSAGESSSISSQKSILEKHADCNGWAVHDCYIDDGYSGTNFNRPGFQRMIDDIEAGKINMVIVKDLSRLGRNYLQTGQYTDIYFPDRGVRFIAVNDGVDTRSSDNDIASIKNIFNEMYSKDISKKVRSAVRAKKQKGEFLSNYAPFGYLKDPTNKNRLVIEDNSAEVVRRIFTLCASGHGSKIIAKTLNKDGVLNPLRHRNRLLGKEDGKQSRWNSETVNNILRSRIYLGDMVQGVYQCSQFKRTPHKRKDRDEWIITPGMHEAIVGEDIWEQAQNSLNSRKRVMRTGEVQLFAGFVKCEDCGHALSYAYSQGIPQYTCGQYRRYGKEACSCHYIRKDTLEQVVMDDIRKYARLAKEDEEGFVGRLLSESDALCGKKLQSLNTELKTAQARYTELDGIIKRLFESTVSGTVSESRFQKLSAGYEEEQATLETRIADIQTDLDTARQTTRDTASWLELIREYADIQELDRIVLSELIDKVTVGETRMEGDNKVTDVTIYYRFVGAVG